MKAPILSSLVLDGRGRDIIMGVTRATFPRPLQKAEAKAWNIVENSYITYVLIYYTVLQINKYVHVGRNSIEFLRNHFLGLFHCFAG